MRLYKSLLIVLALAAAVGLGAAGQCAAEWTVTDLGVLDGFDYSRAVASNAAGQVVGDSFSGAPGRPNNTTSSRAFVWQSGTGLIPLPLLDGFTNSFAVDINASGQIVGTCWNDYYCCDCNSQACLWEWKYNALSEDWEWQATAIVDLVGHLGSTAMAINDAGQVLIHNIGSTNMGPPNDGDDCGGAVWENGTLTDMTTDDGSPIWPDAMNASGQVTGQPCCGSPRPAVTWADGETTVLTPDLVDGTAEGYGINGQGEVVGYLNDGTNRFDFLYLPADAYELLAGLHSSVQEGGFCCNVTSAINDAGQTFRVRTKYLNGRYRSELTVRDLATGEPVASAIVPKSNNDFNVNYPGVMNASGEVIGGCAAPDTTGTYAGYYLSADKGHSYLPSISGPVLDGYTWASSIDDAGQIVGFSSPSEGEVHAAFWTGTAPANEAPVLDAITTPISGAYGVPVELSIAATDANLGDSDFLTYSLLEAPEAAWVQPSTGTFYWTPYTLGSFTFDVVVSDGELTDSQSVTVNVAANEAPVLDAITTPISTAVLSEVTFTAAASDAEDEPLTFSLTGAPAGATINSTTGGFSWTPTTEGSFTFSVTVTDWNGSDSQSVTVNVSDQEPVLDAITTPISAAVLSEVTFTASASDAEGETLTFGLSGAPTGATINATTGAFSWTPSTSGSYTFSVRVFDRNGWDSQDVTINVSDEDPVLDAITTPIAAAVIGEVTFTATASDAEGEALTFGLTGEPAGASIDSSTGAFSWTPSTEGSYTFTVTVSEAHGSDSQSVTVNVSDEDPVLDAIATPIAEVIGSPVSFTASASDTEGETLTFSLSGAPAGASIDATTGAFSWTPATAGSFTFTVTVSDANGSDSQEVTVDVSALPVSGPTISRNRRDIVTVIVTITNPTNAAVSNVSVTAATLDGIPTSSRLPDSVTRSLRAGTSKTCKLMFAGVPAGSATFTLTGTCSAGAFSTTQTLTVP